MAAVFSFLAASVAAWFAYDLISGAVTRPRPHLRAYAAGMSMFALATFASFLSITMGWNGPIYKTFFLFGAVLNVPFLALGSVYLVFGAKAGRAMLGLLMPFTVMSVLLIVPATISDVPDEILPTGSEIFAASGITTLVAIGSGIGASLLIVAGLVSVFRFWRTSKALLGGNLLIVGGTFVAASQRSVVDATGSHELFTVTLLVSVSLIWAGYRLATGQRGELRVHADDLAESNAA